MSAEWRLVDEKELAERIGCTIFAIRQWRRNKHLPFLRIGRLVRFELEAVHSWLAQQQAATKSQ
jgi:excisionase family DNA binding protein